MRISQVCNNLINNAIKFAEPNSKVDIIAEYNDESQKLKLSIIGTSTPIPVDQESLLFKPYAKISNNRRQKDSKGLGLYICKQIIEQLEGTIAYESGISQETIFTILVPCPQTLLEENDTYSHETATMGFLNVKQHN